MTDCPPLWLVVDPGGVYPGTTGAVSQFTYYPYYIDCKFGIEVSQMYPDALFPIDFHIVGNFLFAKAPCVREERFCDGRKEGHV